MNQLAEMLESLDFAQRVEVVLCSGDQFVLSDFETVDESIYNRDDLIVAGIVEVRKSAFRYEVGTLIELALGDITWVKDCETGHMIFESRS